jgi:hypothetical protein
MAGWEDTIQLNRETLEKRERKSGKRKAESGRLKSKVQSAKCGMPKKQRMEDRRWKMAGWEDTIQLNRETLEKRERKAE